MKIKKKTSKTNMGLKRSNRLMRAEFFNANNLKSYKR